MLKFIGIGSAYNHEMGNTSAYIKENNNLLIIDCGETVFSRIKEMNLLNDVENVYIAITHMHCDHVGSLASFISYLYSVKQIMPNLLLPSDEIDSETVENTFREFLNIQGVSEDCYDTTYADMMEDVFSGLQYIEYKKVKHSNSLVSFALEFVFNDKKIIYVGDNNDVKYLTKISENMDESTIVYTDCTVKENNNHITLEQLAEIFDEEKRKRVYCTHFDDFNTINQAKDYGFKVTNRELSKAELLKQISNRKI